MIQSELVQQFIVEQHVLMQQVASLPEEATGRALKRGGCSIKDFVGHIAASQKAILFAARKIAAGMVDDSSDGEFDLCKRFAHALSVRASDCSPARHRTGMRLAIIPWLSVLTALLVTCGASMPSDTAAPASSTPISSSSAASPAPGLPVGASEACSKARLAFLLGNNQNTERLLSLFAANLVEGDFLFVGAGAQQPGWAMETAAQAKERVKAGVNVFSWVGDVSLTRLEANVPQVPKAIDWIVYEYEGGPGFSPEFTKDPTASLAFIERGRKVAHDNGFLYMVTPPYGQLQNANWDWGEVARQIDGIALQFQALLRNLDLLEREAKQVVQQIAEKSPNTLTFVQLSVAPTRGTPQENVTAIQRLEDEKQIKGFLIFYSPSQIEPLTEFFAQFKRCR